MMRYRAAVWILMAVCLTGCDYHFRVDTPIQPSQLPTTPAVTDHIIEFRVTGDPAIVTVTVSNGLDGSERFTSVLPFSHRVSLGDRDNVFLSLDARATSFGFLRAAIYVDGVIFREATSSSFAPVVTVSGTYRRAR